jgi:hypothetical protein
MEDSKEVSRRLRADFTGVVVRSVKIFSGLGTSYA